MSERDVLVLFGALVVGIKTVLHVVVQRRSHARAAGAGRGGTLPTRVEVHAGYVPAVQLIAGGETLHRTFAHEACAVYMESSCRDGSTTGTYLRRSNPRSINGLPGKVREVDHMYRIGSSRGRLVARAEEQ